MKYLKLNDLCNVITCGVAKRPDYVDEGIPFLSSLNVKENRLILNKYNFIKEEDHNTLTKYNKPEINDILYTRVGSYGEAAVVNIDFEFSVFVSLTLIKPKHNLINSRYLMWYLNSPKVRDFAKNNTTGVGVKNLNVSVVREYDVPLLPIETQKAIAEKLDKADALRKKDQELLKQYDELAQSIFIEMFGDPVQNEKGWEINELNNVSTKITDGTHDTPERLSEGIKFITGKHIRPFYIDYKNSDYVTEDVHKEIYKRCNPEYEDILYTNIGVNYATAAMNIVNYEFSMKNVALIKYNRNVFNGRYLEYLLNDENFKDRLKNKFGVGGAQQFLSLKQIKSIEVYLPPLELQNQFADKIKNIEAQKELVKKQAEESENLFQALLQESFNFS
ncbi:type I restriction enzyme, S subunit [Algoriella xinjiangensis]|uniref:Type I restriction enzyme, S subunit n=1 Tax=Algoriella xinjiangensis TaxID=684065 RepID=A0A1I4YV02_9FLAO|nr:restriction endonuclease subunit S [Algoriella xinjiangensis]SFN41855.1 type I restriction enzyme, S subunit [Algoriella xinjiangensis]